MASYYGASRSQTYEDAEQPNVLIHASTASESTSQDLSLCAAYRFVLSFEGKLKIPVLISTTVDAKM